MKLCLISLDYPFGIGSDFLANELKIAQKYFDKIYLISLSSHVDFDNQKYVPDNCEVVVARKKRFEILLLIKSLVKLLSPESINEYFFSRKELRAAPKMIVKEMFIYHYYSVLLERTFRNLDIGEDTVAYSYWMSAPAYFLAGTKKFFYKKISRTHGFDCYIDYSYQPFRRKILEGLDSIYAISDAGKKDIESKLMKYIQSRKDELIKVSRLGVIKESTNLNPDSKSKVLEIVTCSGINKVKRLDIFIEALLKLQIKVRWVHIGSGELELEIKKLAKKLDEKSNITYDFVGRKENLEILKYYSQNHIDLFVNCSDSEGIPVSIMEAMAYGISVIARNVGGNGEIVNETNGFLLPSKESSNHIVNAIMTYYNLELDEKERLRNAAYKTYKEMYDAKKNYNDFYCSILEGEIS